MGIDVNISRCLLSAYRGGVDFSLTATLGRQGMYISDADLQRNLSDFGFWIQGEPNDRHEAETRECRRIIAHGLGGKVQAHPAWPGCGFCEGFLGLLGAKEVESFDISDYEGATHIHDFSLPINEKFHHRYSVVLDAGTLEHVFNFPQAIANCMMMTAKDGYVIEYVPTNNHCGHGFYQFSPELLFRVFSSDNGFAVRRMALVQEDGGIQTEIADPASTGRIETNLSGGVYLLMIAQRVAMVPLFTKPVVQSDYLSFWGWEK
jgi:hypothetical protein